MVMGVSNQQRRDMQRYLTERASRQRQTAAWTSSMVRAEPPNSDVAVDPNHSLLHPPTHPVTAPSGGQRAVYPVTGGRTFGPDGDERGRSPGGSRDVLDGMGTARWASATAPMPVIRVTDCSVGNGTGPGTDPPAHRRGANATAPALVAALDTSSCSAHHARVAPTAPGTPNTKLIAPSLPSASGRLQPPVVSQSSRSVMDPVHPSASGSVFFPPMARSVPTGCSRGLLKPQTRDRDRVTSAASSLWPGDPRAIRSVRRSRRNIDEMLTSMKAGQETRRLIREARPPCSRKCSQPNILTEMERTYVNLPDLMPEIEKARQRLAEQEEEEAAREQAQDDVNLPSAGRRRAGTGRFDLDQEEDACSAKNLPIYQINYHSLREIGGTRRNSVLA